MRLLLFLDQHLWLYHALCAGLLAVTGWLAAHPLLPSGAPKFRWAGRPAFFLLVLVATLFALRYPIFFYPTYLEMDEAQMLAQAITFQVHPIPWRDMDTGTGGPLDSDALLWCVPFGIQPTYLTGRVFGLLCVAGMLVLLHLTCRRLAGEALARLAILPVFLFFGFTSMFDWVHYTSEHLSLLLLAAGAYLLTGLWRRPDGWLRALALGSILGLLPFAKLQSVLPGAFLGCAGLVILAIRGPRLKGSFCAAGLRRAVPLIAGALLPPAILLSIVAWAGGFNDFWKSYIEMAHSYTQGALTEGHDTRWFSLVARLRLVVSMIFDPRLESAFPVYLTAVISCWAGFRLLPKPRHRSKVLPRNLSAVLLFSAVLAATVVYPVRKFPHYVLYVMVGLPLLLAAVLRMARRELKHWTDHPAPGPSLELARDLGWGALLAAGVAAVLIGTWTLWPLPYSGTIALFTPPPGPVPYVIFPLIGLAALLIADQRRLSAQTVPAAAWTWRSRALATYLIPFFLIPAMALACYPNPYLGHIAAFRRQPPSAIDRAILELRPPGGRAAIWGYQPDYLAETATVCGVRTCASGYEILPSPLRDYYRARFLEDMQRNRPELFIQAVSPQTYYAHDAARQGIQSFPELAALIAEEYRLARTIDGVEFFVRRDLAAPEEKE